MIPCRLLALAASLGLFAAFARGARAAEPAARPAAKAAEAPSGRPQTKKKTAAKAGKETKKKAAPESKYKSRELSEGSEHSYRFDARGTPVGGGPKKKQAEKGKKKPSGPPDGTEEKTRACSAEEPCAGKDADADAL